MAIASNKSNDKVAEERKLYTGLINMKVKAINPSMEEMKSMGMNPSKEPVYVTDEPNGEGQEGTHKRVRLDFYLYREGDPKVNAKMALWVEDIPRVSKTGKNEYLNAYGQSAWSEGEPTYDWFKKEGLRKAYSGESTLIEFIKNWANVKVDGECSLETMDKIVQGDIKELKQYVNDLRDNFARVLLGVQETGGNLYQAVYTKMFDRPYNTSTVKWKKQLEDVYGDFKDADYQNSFELQVYNGKSETDQDNPDAIGGGFPEGPAEELAF